MAAQVTIVGGGSTHWTPQILVDLANTPSLQDARVVLVDIDRDRLDAVLPAGAHIAKSRDIPLEVTATTNLDEGLQGADFVISAFSVGGFTSMRHDIEIPAAFGIRQPVGDSVGPGGIFRALRSIPVLLSIARAVERNAPQALLVNVSNPLTACCRAVTRETGVRTVGLCNELVGLQFSMSLLFDVGLDQVDPVVGGVNHLPLVTELRIGGADGFAKLRDLLASPGDMEDPESPAGGPIWMDPMPAMHWRKASPGPRWTKGDVLANNKVKLDLLQRFGVLPGSSDTHVVEFFAGFVTPESDFGREWGAHHYGMPGHLANRDEDDAGLASLLSSTEISPWPSGELVAPLLDGIVSGAERPLPMNLPNTGQVASVGAGVVVECMGMTGPVGVAPRDEAVQVPFYLGEQLRRVVASQELTVDAALTGDPTTVLAAMLTDPMTSRLAYAEVVRLTDALLAATAPWLPQFA